MRPHCAKQKQLEFGMGFVSELTHFQGEKVKNLCQETCARYQAEPDMSQLTQFKKDLKNGTCKYSILCSYAKGTILKGYYDASWGGSADGRERTSGGCPQLVWLKKILKGYNVEQHVVTLYCGNLSAIKNSIQHRKMKHIVICEHFTNDSVEENVAALEHADIKEQSTILIKALDAEKFENLRGKLGICLHEEA
ncbi:gag-pol polyprotein [Trifolium pratense]|nr:gag-pol polyprotein [Trifolium pratense]